MNFLYALTSLLPFTIDAMIKFEYMSDESVVKTTDSFFSQEFVLFFWPLSVLTWSPVSLHQKTFKVVERSNGRDWSLLSTLYKDMGND